MNPLIRREPKTDWEKLAREFTDQCVSEWSVDSLAVVTQTYRGGILSAQQCSRLLSSRHGHVGDKKPYLTGGVEIYAYPPVPEYGPSRPYYTRLRGPWTYAQLERRVATAFERLDSLTVLRAERDRVYGRMNVARLYAAGVQFIEDGVISYGLPYDCSDMTLEDCGRWLEILRDFESVDPTRLLPLAQ